MILVDKALLKAHVKKSGVVVKDPDFSRLKHCRNPPIWKAQRQHNQTGQSSNIGR